MVGVKLQKINVKKFSGDPVAWQEFEEIFNATVHQNPNLTDVEKFSYLKGYLIGPADKCIEGLPLSNENYNEARTLLRERFGNPQLIVASHMYNLLKIERVTNGKDCKGLRCLHDQVESHVRALNTAGVTSEHYGSLLIPIIAERLPDDIRLQISRRLGATNWKIEEFMFILKEEIAARENCDFLKRKEQNDKTGRDGHLTTEALHTGVKMLKCAFCKNEHYHDKCNLVTDLAERRRIVYEGKLCYRCLSTNKHRFVP